MVANLLNASWKYLNVFPGKVAHYSECYAFGDDIHPVMKVLNEQKHLSCKEIHPHTMEMVEDQIDKQEKVNYQIIFVVLSNLYIYLTLAG